MREPQRRSTYIETPVSEEFRRRSTSKAIAAAVIWIVVVLILVALIVVGLLMDFGFLDAPVFDSAAQVGELLWLL